MKSFRRRFCASLLSVLLLVGFSIPVNAKDDISPSVIKYNRETEIVNSMGHNSFFSLDHYSNDPYTTFIETTVSMGIPQGSNKFESYDIFRVYNENGSHLFKGGQETKVSIYDIYIDIGVNDTSGFRYARNFKFEKILVLYKNGQSQYINTYDSFEKNNGTVNVSFTFTPSSEVYSIEVHISNSATIGNTNGATLNLYSGFTTNKSTTLSVAQTTEESSLLSGILGWIQNLFNSITEGFTNIGNWFSNLFNSLTEGFANIGKWFAELPQKLWAVISEGLKSLFVPDDEYMSSYSDKWDTLLSSRFGAVYQVVDIVDSTMSRIEATEGDGTIIFDGFNLEDVGIGEGWLFPPMQVHIVPEGFEYIADVIKGVIAIVCTLMFVNGLIKRYEEIMTK